MSVSWLTRSLSMQRDRLLVKMIDASFRPPDADALSAVLSLHPSIAAKPLVDSTYGIAEGCPGLDLESVGERLWLLVYSRERR